MTLHEKILTLCPNLTAETFITGIGNIQLQNDGHGDYIKSWENIEYSRPTQQELDSVMLTNIGA